MAIITTGASPNELKIDTNGSAEVLANDPNGNALPRLDGSAMLSQQYGMPMLVRNDDQLRLLRGGRAGGVALNTHMPLLFEPFDSATVNTNRWLTANTTFVPAQTIGGGYNFNPTNLVTANAVAILTSNRRIPKTLSVPLQAKFRFRASRITNSQIEMGFGAPATTALPADGAFIRIAGSNLYAVLTSGSVEVAVSAPVDITSLIDPSSYYTADIVVFDDYVRYTVQNTQSGAMVLDTNLDLPTSAARLWGASHMPIFGRVFNGAVAPATAPIFVLSDIFVSALDINGADSASAQQALMGLGSIVRPDTGLQAAQFANSAAPASAVLSNTAAGYATLGGLFQFAAVAGAATDYCLFGFQVPVGNDLVVEGVDIDAWNTGAANATTPTLLVWSLAANAAAVSLANTGYAKIPLGAQQFPTTAAIGELANRTISIKFDTPIVVNSGRFIAIALRIPVGTATAAQVIQGSVGVRGHFR
jgi:hypothetical protein